MAVDVGKLIAESIDGFYAYNKIIEEIKARDTAFLESLFPGITLRALNEGPDWDNYDDDSDDDDDDGGAAARFGDVDDDDAGDDDEASDDDDDEAHAFRMKNDPSYRAIHKDDAPDDRPPTPPDDRPPAPPAAGAQAVEKGPAFAGQEIGKKPAAAGGADPHRKGYQAGWVAAKRGGDGEPPAGKEQEYNEGYRDGFGASGHAHKISAGVAKATELHAAGDKEGAAAHVLAHVQPHAHKLAAHLTPHLMKNIGDREIGAEMSGLAPGGTDAERNSQARAVAVGRQISDWLKDRPNNPGQMSSFARAVAKKVADHAAAEGAGTEHKDHPSTFADQLSFMSKGFAGLEKKGRKARQDQAGGTAGALWDLGQKGAPGVVPGRSVALDPAGAEQAKKIQKGLQTRAGGMHARAKEVQAPAIDQEKQREAGEAVAKLAVGSGYDPAQHGEMNHEEGTKTFQRRALARLDALIASGNQAVGNKPVQTMDGQMHSINMGDFLRHHIGDPDAPNGAGEWVDEVDPETGEKVATFKPSMFKRGSGSAYLANTVHGYQHDDHAIRGTVNGLVLRAKKAFFSNFEALRQGGEAPETHSQRIAALGAGLRDIGHQALQPISVDQFEVPPPPGITVNNNSLDPVQLLADHTNDDRPGKGSMAAAFSNQIPQWNRITDSFKGLKGNDLTSHPYYPFWNSMVGRKHKHGKQLGSVFDRAHHAIVKHSGDWHEKHPAYSMFTQGQGVKNREHDSDQDQRLIEDEMLSLFSNWLDKRIELYPGQRDTIITELRNTRDGQQLDESLWLVGLS